jgi:putative toxin-antitoxin system antitoxin component (TIGR02293 family)
MSEVAESLGGARVLGHDTSSDLAWVELLQNGLPTACIATAMESGILTSAELYACVISRRMLSRRRGIPSRLTIEESDRLSRITRLTIRATETFGSRESAIAWLRECNGALRGARPLDILRSGEGGVLVEQILTRINHGVYT